MLQLLEVISVAERKNTHNEKLAEQLGYPIQHINKLQEMCEGKTPPQTIITTVDGEGKAETKGIKIEKRGAGKKT